MVVPEVVGHSHYAVCMQGSKGSKQVTQAKQLNVAINGFGRIGEPLLWLPSALHTKAM